MKRSETTYKELMQFADWVARHRVALIPSTYATDLNNIIHKARVLTNETQTSDIPARSENETRR